MKANNFFYPCAAFFIGLGSGIYEIDIIRLSKIVFRFDIAFVWFAAAIFFIICGHASTIIRKPSASTIRHAAVALGSAGLICHISPWPWYFLFPLFPFFFIGRAHTLLYSNPDINHLVYVFEAPGFALGMSIAGPHITSVSFLKIPGAITISGLLFLIAFYTLSPHLKKHPETSNPKTSKAKTPSKLLPFFYILLVCLPLTVNICLSDWLSKNAAIMESPISTHLKEDISKNGLKSHVCHETLSSRTDEVINSKDQTRFYTDAMFCAKAVRIKTSPGNNPESPPSYKLINPATEKLAFLKRLPFKLMRQNSETKNKKRPDQKLKKVLNLGAGAGFDTLIALQEGAEHITAVEINSIITSRAMKMSRTSGICYLDKRVELINDEARSWLMKSNRPNKASGMDNASGMSKASGIGKASNEKFDLITLALMESSDSAGPSAMFIHAPLFTEQAFELYWESLSENGMIAVIHNQRSPVNSNIAALLSMFAKKNIKNPDTHFSVILPDKPFINSFDHLLLISKMPFSEKQIIKIKGILKDRSMSKEIFHLENSARIITTMTAAKQRAPKDNSPFLFSKIYGFQNMFGLFILLFLILFSCFFVYLKKAVSKNVLKTSLTLFTASAGIIMIQTALLYLGQSLLGYPSKATALIGGVAVLGSVTGVVFCSKKTGLFIFTVPIIWIGLYWIYRPFDFNFFTLLRYLPKYMPEYLSQPQIVLSCITYICFLFTGLVFIKAMTSNEHKTGDDTKRNKITAVYLFSDGLGYITGATAALLISFIWGYSSLVINGIVLFSVAAAICMTVQE